MSTQLRNNTAYESSPLPLAFWMKIGIAVAEWNPEVTMNLLDGALSFLSKAGIKNENIQVLKVPGSFELTAAASWLAASDKTDAVIILGCVIQGETRHFDFICQGVTQGITQLNLSQTKPVIFGLLTTLTQQQALDRAGGKLGNKGSEAAETAIRMLGVKSLLK
jgi:6,7-dimethyl-8-ribityllumazine synthase